MIDLISVVIVVAGTGTLFYLAGKGKERARWKVEQKLWLKEKANLMKLNSKMVSEAAAAGFRAGQAARRSSLADYMDLYVTGGPNNAGAN